MLQEIGGELPVGPKYVRCRELLRNTSQRPAYFQEPTGTAGVLRGVSFGAHWNRDVGG
jgi:hypothetical protein